MYQVYSKVPIPKPRTTVSDRVRKYPFLEMEVGDMFFVPNANRKTLAGHASATGRQLERKFSTRAVYMADAGGEWVPCTAEDAGAVFGVGVWRVK